MTSNRFDVIELLLASGADINVADEQGNTLLFKAVSSGNLPHAQKLLDMGADLQHLNLCNESVLFTAIRGAGGRPMIEYLINRGVNVDVINTQGKKAVVVALDMVKMSCLRSIGDRGRVFAKPATRDVIRMLIDSTANLYDSNGLPCAMSCLGVCLRIDILYYFYEDMPTTVLAVKHGATAPYTELFRVAMQQKEELDYSARRNDCLFFTLQFAMFLRAGGVRLHGIDDMIKSLPIWAERKYGDLLRGIIRESGQPMSLQEWCRIVLRDILAVKGHMWELIDQLPVPTLLKTYIKLSSSDYGHLLCL